MNLFASANMHISFVAEPVFHIGNFTVNNAMTLGAIGLIVTLLLSFYDDIYLDKLIPIKYVDKKKIILYGFPKEPYEVICEVSE